MSRPAIGAYRKMAEEGGVDLRKRAHGQLAAEIARVNARRLTLAEIVCAHERLRTRGRFDVVASDLRRIADRLDGFHGVIERRLANPEERAA